MSDKLCKFVQKMPLAPCSPTLPSMPPPLPLSREQLKWTGTGLQNRLFMSTPLTKGQAHASRGSGGNRGEVP